MTFNEAKLRTKLGMKVRLSIWSIILYVSAFGDDGTYTFHLAKGEVKTKPIPKIYTELNDWEVYHEV